MYTRAQMEHTHIFHVVMVSIFLLSFNNTCLNHTIMLPPSTIHHPTVPMHIHCTRDTIKHRTTTQCAAEMKVVET